MLKLRYVIAVILTIMLFNSCYSRLIFQPEAENIYDYAPKPNLYGSYLSGRLAHLRQNFDVAADSYIDVLKRNPENKELLSRIYIILASQGRIPEAAKYAKESLKNGDKNNFTHIIIAVDEMKESKYPEAILTLKNLKGVVYEEFITPLLTAWAYVGENNKEKAIETLDILKRNQSFYALHQFHAGMIYDYFNDKENAQKHYEYIITKASTEMSFRALQVITNFYLRTNQKDKAVALAKKYNDEKLFVDMLKNLSKKVENANPATTKKIINDPNIGVSEALFSVAATLRQGPAGMDLAHIFICLSVYANPDYDLARLLLADILESRGLYKDANLAYDKIKENSEAYFSAQAKKGANLVMMQDLKSAELLFKSLIIDHKNNPQIYFDLADVLRMKDKQEEAIKYYKLSLEKTPEITNQQWVLFYALGISQERSGKWVDAEENFKKALEMSNQHYLVLNYLGYSWIKQGQNVNKAFDMIVEANNQAHNDGNIADSLGYAFYLLGMFDKSIEFLEKSSNLESANAVIYDHLGDAYWQAGRKNEARHQWSHALIMKDDTKEIDYNLVKQKIKTGLPDFIPLPYDKEKIEASISKIEY